eukprot:XP_008654037.1 serine/arginine repetitive matrix protein 1 [Zea mays]
MVDEGGKGEAQPPGLDPRTRRSAATRATGDMDGGGRGEEWEGPPATCSRSRRRRCPCPSPSPAWTPPSGARGAAISATVAIRRAGGPSGSPSPRRRRQRGQFPHRRRPIIRPRRAVPVLGGGLCGGSKWFPPGSRSPPRRDPRCSPRKDGDLLYPAIHSPTELLSERALSHHPRLPPPRSAPPYPAYASPPSHPQPLLHRATLKTSTASDFPGSTPPPGCFPSGVAISSTARSMLLSKEGRGLALPRDPLPHRAAFLPRSRTPPMRDPRCSPWKAVDLLYPDVEISSAIQGVLLTPSFSLFTL